MATTSDILLLSGIPGSGKTQYTDWLERAGWDCLRVDDWQTWPPMSVQAFNAAVAGADEGLLALASVARVGVVLEWGFPMTHFTHVEAMLSRGYNGWFFTGDREAAFAAWCKRRPTASAGDKDGCRFQIASLLDRMEDIRRVYGDRVIYTVKRDGPHFRHMSERKIHKRVGLAEA